MVEQREAHDSERRELEALQAALIAELRRRLLVADSFVPDAGRPAVLRARYNEDSDAWELRDHSGVEPLTERPRRGRRPGAAENVLALAPLPLPATTRPYPRRAPHQVSITNARLSPTVQYNYKLTIRSPTAGHRPLPLWGKF